MRATICGLGEKDAVERLTAVLLALGADWHGPADAAAPGGRAIHIAGHAARVCTEGDALALEGPWEAVHPVVAAYNKTAPDKNEVVSRLRHDSETSVRFACWELLGGGMRAGLRRFRTPRAQASNLLSHLQYRFSDRIPGPASEPSIGPAGGNPSRMALDLARLRRSSFGSPPVFLLLPENVLPWLLKEPG